MGFWPTGAVDVEVFPTSGNLDEAVSGEASSCAAGGGGDAGSGCRRSLPDYLKGVTSSSLQTDNTDRVRRR